MIISKVLSRQLWMMTLATLLLPALGLSQGIASDLSPAVATAAKSAFPEYEGGSTFDSILASGTTFPDPIIIIRSYDANPGGGPANQPPLYPSQHIKNLVNRSDFAGIGVPLKRWTFPTSDNTFAVSVYLVHVSTVSIPGKEKVAEGQDIYIARAGGPITYLGHNFRAVNPDFQLFRLNEPYFFFAENIGPNLFKVDAPRTLKIEGSTVKETSEQNALGAFFSTKTPDAILNEARDAKRALAQEKGDRE